jgi:glucose-6-phosphate isomerase
MSFLPALEGAKPDSLASLFANDPGRVEHFAFDLAGIRFDFSKTHLTRDLVGRIDAGAYGAALNALASGEVVNPTEGRAAEHLAERGTGSPDAVALARQRHARLRGLVDAIEAGAFGDVTGILHIGIGGSALGPALLVDALGRTERRFHVEILSNIDGQAVDAALSRLDPATTLIAIASKTFTTAETLRNADAAIAWLEEAGVEDPYGRLVAITAAPERAVEFGIDETRILPFAESVGGRYSLWSSIGFPAAVALGVEAFEELLEGAALVDAHVLEAEPQANVPLLAAAADLLYSRGLGAETRATFAYDDRLRLLPSYLQQLVMESNGKSATLAGGAIDGHTSAILWGGVGTDAQHAVFQLLHQGTHLVPVEFVGVIEQGDEQDPAHHRELLLNMLAQGAALMAGRSSDDAHRNYPGNRPSTFAEAVLLGINPFDQFGVELGKEMARAIDDPGARAAFDPSTRALIERAGL